MIDVILLAGGESTRFWPFTDKNLTPFFGKPLLSWHYEQFVRLGIKNVVVVANSETNEKIQSVPVPKKLTVTFIVQEGKGQGQAVLAAGSSFEDRPSLILNASDIYEDDVLKTVIDTHNKDQQSLLVTVVRVKSYFPGAYVRLKEDGTILDMVEKPKEGTEPSDMVTIFVYAIPNMKDFCAVLKSYSKRPADGYERSVNKMIKNGISAKPIITSSDWLYLKYPWHVLNIMDACLATIDGQHIDPSVKIGKFTTIEGPVIIEEGVKISEGTKIVGPVFIGKGTIVGNNNIIRHSHIGSMCVTGFNTDITRSYVGSNCWFHTNYLGDSIIASNVSMGSGTVCANLRLDESAISSKVKEEPINTKRVKLGAMIGSNVRIGVNVSIMPGIKIGSGSFVGAGVVLGEDLGDGKYCHVAPTVVISDNTKKAAESREEFKKKL